jgi:hypothetical protein
MDGEDERTSTWTLFLAAHSGALTPDEIARLLALIRAAEAERQAPDAPADDQNGE